MKVRNFSGFKLNEGNTGGGNKFILVRFGNSPVQAVSQYFAEVAVKNPKPSLMKGPGSFVTMFETALTKEALVSGFDRLGISYNLYQVVHSSNGGPTASIVAREPSKAQLEAKLKAAVEAEDYDEATRLRDKIAAMSGAPAPVSPTASNPSESKVHSFNGFLLENAEYECSEDFENFVAKLALHESEVFTGDSKHVVGSKWEHAKYGEGEIVKDPEGLCRKGEVTFQPIDRTKLPGGGNDGKFDIVDVSDLTPIK